MTKEREGLFSFEYKLPKDMLIPNFAVIMQHAIRELVNKYPDYENSWLRSDDDFWLRRISNETEEYKNAMTVAARKRKLVNLFNLCAMQYHVLDQEE